MLGVYDSGMESGNTDAFWEHALWSPSGKRAMTGLPINMYLNPWYGQADVGEIAALEQALLADDVPGALTSDSTPTAIRTKVKVINGTGYVFAYNHTNANVTATFGWNAAPGTITVNAENRTVVASGSSFTDRFGPYQAHVYVLATGGTADGGQTGSASPNGRGASY